MSVKTLRWAFKNGGGGGGGGDNELKTVIAVHSVIADKQNLQAVFFQINSLLLSD